MKRKLIQEDIAEIKRKKATLESCISSMKTGIDMYSIQAEKKQDLSLLSKANSFRRTVTKKEKEKAELEDAVKKLMDQCKQL